MKTMTYINVVVSLSKPEPAVLSSVQVTLFDINVGADLLFDKGAIKLAFCRIRCLLLCLRKVLSLRKIKRES